MLLTKNQRKEMMTMKKERIPGSSLPLSDPRVTRPHPVGLAQRLERTRGGVHLDDSRPMHLGEERDIRWVEPTAGCHPPPVLYEPILGLVDPPREVERTPRSRRHAALARREAVHDLQTLESARAQQLQIPSQSGPILVDSGEETILP